MRAGPKPNAVQEMKKLEALDSHHLDFAQGWLGLGDWAAANRELDEIRPELFAHPDVLQVRLYIYEAAKQWTAAAQVARALTIIDPDSPLGWIHWAYSLRELKRTQEAWNTLLAVVNKFPYDYVIRYHLSCYAGELGKVSEASYWLQKAIDLIDDKDVKQQPPNNPDFLA